MSQIVNHNDTECYAIFDENNLYFFDIWNSAQPTDTICFKNFETFNNYSGFNYINNDTIFLYRYSSRKLFLSNALAETKRVWKIEDPDDVVLPRALAYSPILYRPPYTILSGCRLGHPDDTYGDTFHTSAIINTDDSSINYECNYPEVYRHGNFGGVYMNEIFHTIDTDGRVVYSFPADHNIYRLNTITHQVDSLYMGSRYTPAINSTTDAEMKILIDKDLRIKYFISQHSYSNILYDHYNHVYYRIARHPLNQWDGGAFVQPISVIAMTTDGSILSETPIINYDGKLTCWNMHVCSKGLLIQEDNENEDIISFKLLQLHE
jgi:hypothetical protein